MEYKIKRSFARSIELCILTLSLAPYASLNILIQVRICKQGKHKDANRLFEVCIQCNLKLIRRKLNEIDFKYMVLFISFEQQAINVLLSCTWNY